MATSTPHPPTDRHSRGGTQDERLARTGVLALKGGPAVTGTPTVASGIATKIWVLAALCWVATFAAVVLGADAHGHHDVVLEESTLSWPVRLAVFAAAWQVMIGAMMLPSTIPMLELFWTVSARRPRPAAARTALVAPYLLIWLGFAGLALAGDAAVHRAVDTWEWLADREGLILGATLVLAGAFQFSSLKKACLAACRSPLSMMWEHYGRGVRSAWRLGVHHALFCLGCCWALMLVMFATGAGSLAWMLLLTALMVVEKVTTWGSRIVTPTGIAFIAAGVTLCAVAMLFPQ